MCIRDRLMLMGLRDRADYVIDTTDMLPQKLRSTIRGLFATGSERKGLAVTCLLYTSRCV